MNSIVPGLLLVSSLFTLPTEAGTLRRKELDHHSVVEGSGFDVIGSVQEFVAPVDDDRDAYDRSPHDEYRALEIKEYNRDESLDLVS